MMPCRPPIVFCSIVGHAMRHTAAPSGPSTMERSYLAAGWAGCAGGAADAESAAAGVATGAGRTTSSGDSDIRALTRAGTGAGPTSEVRITRSRLFVVAGNLHPIVKRRAVLTRCADLGCSAADFFRLKPQATYLQATHL